MSETGTNAAGVKTISLDPGIYKTSAVKAAIKDYSGAARITMESGDGRLIVTLSGYPDDLADNIGHEFCNYVLWKLRN